MATVTYTNGGTCPGGGHRIVGVQYNGGATQTFVYTTDELLAPLSALTTEERALIALAILKIHDAGKTRSQVATEFASPVTVTI